MPFTGLADIEVQVVARSDLSTPLSTLANRKQFTFAEVLNDSGSWQAALFNDDAALADLGTSKFVNVYVRGVLSFTGMCEQSHVVLKSNNEEIDEGTEWSGGGHIDVMKEAVVFTDLALGVEPTPENRVFNYSSVFYQSMGADTNDPTVTWVPATVVTDVATAQASWPVLWDADFAPGQETVVQILWASDGTTTQAQGGTCYFSQVINLGAFGGQCRFQFTVDNVGELNLDAQLVVGAEAGGSGTFTNMGTRDIYISPGLHVVSGWGSNLPLGQPFGLNPAGFAWALYEVDGDGQLGAFITGSNSTAVMVEYADHVPGMTPGMVLKRLITEAQGTDSPYVGVRNDNAAPTAFTTCLTDLTYTFDELLDSNGDTWPIYPDIALRVGTDYFTVLQQLHASGYIDFSMTPGTLELNAYIADGLTSTPGVDYHRPTDPLDESTGNITKWEETKEVVKASALLVRWGPTWMHREENSSITAYGRKEAMLDIGAAQSPAEAARLADADLAKFGAPRTETNIEILPQSDADTPYVGYSPMGATITLEGVPHKVLGMAVTEDIATGRAIFTPTLNDGIVLSFAERIAKWETRMIPGTIGGRSDVATPHTPVFIPRPTTFPFFPTSECLSDSFNAADDTFPGADIAWASGSAGLTSKNPYLTPYFGATVYGTETDPLANQCLTVQGNTGAGRMPDDSLLASGEVYWRYTTTARAVPTLATADMRVSATISGLPGGGSFGGYWLFARSEDSGGGPLTDLELSVPIGWFVEWDDGYVVLYCNYLSPVYSPGNVMSFLVVDDSPAITLAPGDELALTVTGPTATPTVTVTLNGGTLLFADSGTGYGPGPYAGDSDADYPAGLSAGRGFIQTSPGGPSSNTWNHGTMDNTMSMDGWEACPA